MRPKNIISFVIAVTVIAMLGGCASHEQKKQAVVEHWEKSTAQAKLSTVESLMERGQIAEAKKTLEKCLETEPESAMAHFLMGRVYFIENRTAEAEMSFGRAVMLDSTLDAAWYFRGGLAFSQGDTAMAMAYYQKAMSLQPAKIEYVVSAAQLLMHTGDYTAAQTLLTQAMGHKLRNRDLLVCMAELYSRMKQPEKAIDCYEQILLLNSRDQQALQSLGYCYVTQKDWNKAAQTFETLLNIISDDAHKESVLESLGMCAMNAGRYGQALKCYDKLSLIRRDDPEAWLNMALAALGADLPKRAAYSAQKALQLKPSWSQAYAVLGSSQYLTARYIDALASFARVREDDQMGGFAWFMTGRCYARLGQTANAETAYKKAGDFSKDNLLISRFLKEKTDAL